MCENTNMKLMSLSTSFLAPNPNSSNVYGGVASEYARDVAGDPHTDASGAIAGKDGEIHRYGY